MDRNMLLQHKLTHSHKTSRKFRAEQYWMRLLGGLAITVMTLYCAPRGRRGKGRSIEGSGLYPELAAYRISEGSSPNVQAEVGRLVGQLPIEQARGELARRGLELDEKAVRRLAPATCSGSVPGICPRATNSLVRGSRSGLMVAGSGCGLSLRRSASVARRSGGSFESSGASPRCSSCSRPMRRGGWPRGAGRSSTARCKARMR